MDYIDIITEAPFEAEIIQPAISNEADLELNNYRPFIEANTIESSLADIKKHHIIPVYIKDNETLISHYDFIETTMNIVNAEYCNERISQPIVRVSHPMKGRIPEARNKPANELLENEKTLYYERMAFIIEIPSIQGVVGGNTLSLTVGGVKSYSQDNLYSKKGSDEHFKVFIGYKNSVCTNLCVWTDGFMSDLKVNSIGQLEGAIKNLVERYNGNYQLSQMQQLSNYLISEKQFSFLIGRCRMYPYLSQNDRNEISPLLFGDQQLGAIIKDYFRDKDFHKDADGNINLWNLYNLFTGVNKSSYIDSFLDRSVNAFQFVEQIRMCLDKKLWSWFISPIL
jgi:hypothetical protein